MRKVSESDTRKEKNMALPQDGQNANALATVKEVPTGKKLIFVDPTTNEGGIITLEDLTTQILKNLTSQTFALDQGNMTLLAALNQLNSNCLVSVDADSENINLRIKKIYYWNSGSKLVAVCEDKDGNIENKFI